MISIWFTLFPLFVAGVVGQDGGQLDISARVPLFHGIETDCSNSTHRWMSQNGRCFDEETGPIPYIAPPERVNAFGRYLGGIGVSRRESGCPADQTTCWIVNCCQPGETCGPITVGCVASWSTIYTTTTTTSWSTIVNTISPSSVSYTTATASTTAYLTSYRQVTLPGAGLDTVVTTVTTTSTSLIFSAYTPPAVTVTETQTSAATITQAPIVKRELLPRADLPRRQARTSYTTLTVHITTYYTAFSTSTLAGNLATTTKIIGVSQTATRNQTHYVTPTGFTTITQTVTSVVPSYAFGSLDPITQTLTEGPTGAIIAGVSPTNSAGSSNQTNPPGADSASSGLSTGAIAGIAVGVVLALVLLALGLFFCCCLRRRRNRRETYTEKHRRNLDDLPSPPSPPTPQMVSATPSPPYMNASSSSPTSSASPVMVGAVPAPQRAYHSSNNNNNSRLAHGRKSSRSSIVSITPVPEEDEEDEYDMPITNGRGPQSRRNSNDSSRSWGRGYGGRGGYYGGNGSRTNLADPRRSGNGGANSPTHPSFRGVITSTYSDESLIPPHAR